MNTGDEQAKEMNKRTNGTGGGKYASLFHHLTALGRDRWTTTFAGVERVLGFALPNSARRYRQWWANQANGRHTQARAWMEAGWRTGAVILNREIVVFERAKRNAVGGGRSRRSRAVPAAKSRRQRTSSQASERRPRATEATLAVDAERTTFGGQAFRFVAHIAPEIGADGELIEDAPHTRYAAANPTSLHRHGRGPFCRFHVPGLPAAPGVYAVTVARGLAYVGISTDLRRRWSPLGYARIYPRNCLKGGQSTNCKVNHAILLAARDGLRVGLWIRQTSEPRPLEARLVQGLTPPWND